MVFLLLPRESQVTADKVEWLAVEARVGNRNRPPHFNFRLEPAILLFLTIGTFQRRSMVYDTPRPQRTSQVKLSVSMTVTVAGRRRYRAAHHLIG